MYVMVLWGRARRQMYFCLSVWDGVDNAVDLRVACWYDIWGTALPAAITCRHRQYRPSSCMKRETRLIDRLHRCSGGVGREHIPSHLLLDAFRGRPS